MVGYPDCDSCAKDGVVRASREGNEKEVKNKRGLRTRPLLHFIPIKRDANIRHKVAWRPCHLTRMRANDANEDAGRFSPARISSSSKSK